MTATMTIFKITENYGTLQRLVQTVSPFISDDDARLILTCAHITNHEGKLRVEGTDSYKLIRLDTPIEAPAENLDLLLDWWAFTHMLKSLRFRSAPVEVTLDPTGRTLRVANGTESLITSFITTEGQYPNIENLIPHPDACVIEPGAFNVDNLHILSSALKGRPSTEPVRILQMGAMKPLILTMPTGEWRGLVALMPVRIP